MDYTISIALLKLRNSFGIALSKIITNAFVLLAIAILMILLQKTKLKKFFSAIAISATLIISEALKFIIKRPRPPTAITTKVTYSMPSSHAAVAFSLVPLAFKINKKCGTAMLITAIAIAFSRLYQGMHYLSDVVVGALIGMAISYLTLYLERKLRSK